MLLYRQIIFSVIIISTFAKSIETQSGWYFPPFSDDNDGYRRSERKLIKGRSEDSLNSIERPSKRVKAFADHRSGQLAYASSMAYDVEQRLASAVKLTRKTRMYFFYGLMLKSWNYMKDLRISSQRLIKDIRKSVNELERLRKSRSKRFKMSTKMESIGSLLDQSTELEERIYKASEEFNRILNDFMDEVYAKKAKYSSRSKFDKINSNNNDNLNHNHVDDENEIVQQRIAWAA